MRQSVVRAEKIEIYKTLKRPVATYRAESWTVNEVIDKRLAACKRKVLRRLFGGIKVNRNWSKRYNKKQMQLLGD
jgi:hypothetical protein